MSEEKLKPYVPSEEEMKEAEDTMTDKQTELTNLMEGTKNKWEELGIKELYYSSRPIEGTIYDEYVIRGNIKGYEVEFVSNPVGSGFGTYTAKIDGKIIDDIENSEKLYRKYLKLAANEETLNTDKIQAKQEINEHHKIQAKKNKIDKAIQDLLGDYSGDNIESI